MKNIAIVLGTTNYQRIEKLPGSFNDAKCMYEILTLTEKFDEILYLNEDKNSQDTKDSIIDFFDKHKGSEIKEFVFYFSGHGEFLNDEFYFLLVDYDSFKRNQTSLQNSVIDDLIRSINPEITVKIIDACNSGNQYIKDSSSVTSYLDSSKTNLKNCYFLFSSQAEQSSYQTRYISDFTNSFIQALKNHSTTEIRYRHIIDYIADEFSLSVDQRPLFIIQAENTEKFCSVNESLKKYLNDYSGVDPKITFDGSSTSSTFASTIISDSQNYCTIEEAQKQLETIKSIVNSFTIDSEIAQLYNYSINFESNYDSIIDIKSLAGFLSREKDENNYFVSIFYEIKKIEEPIYNNPYYIGESYVTGQQTGTKEKEVQVPVKFDLNFEPTYKCINIEVIPKYHHLQSYNCKIVYVLSRKYIRFFNSVNHYIENGWDIKSLNNDVKWKTEEYPLKDTKAVSTYLEKINTSINETIIKRLKEKYKIETNQETEN